MIDETRGSNSARVERRYRYDFLFVRPVRLRIVSGRLNATKNSLATTPFHLSLLFEFAADSFLFVKFSC
jgi:hypothetical protein